MKTKQYRVWAGEGTGQGHLEGYATTLRGARRMATIARCDGDRWAYIEYHRSPELGKHGWDRIE